MRFDRFTLKSQELIQNANTLASTHGNQQIEPEHLLAAMLEEKEIRISTAGRLRR
jgi:ATP-dependent Clp protease ATP-binding subunit ClpB